MFSSSFFPNTFQLLTSLLIWFIFDFWSSTNFEHILMVFFFPSELPKVQELCIDHTYPLNYWVDFQFWLVEPWLGILVEHLLLLHFRSQLLTYLKVENQIALFWQDLYHYYKYWWYFSKSLEVLDHWYWKWVHQKSFVDLE